MIGSHSETALHWAASSGDLEALDALLDAGADPNPSGAVITGGTPLSDAVIFAKWAAARRLVERGATMTIWQAAALGEAETVAAHLADGDVSQDDLDNACWHACRTGQLGTARLLVDRGSLVDRPGHEDKTARQLAAESGAADLIAFLDGVEDPRSSG
jgi:ankyrin repeat protein